MWISLTGSKCQKFLSFASVEANLSWKMINAISISLVVSLAFAHVNGQYEQGRGGYYTPSQVAILMHRQALGQDGSFKYAFSADNGLQQGEVINPDGSRTGSYSYVDPNGKTISLKYTAGKDGFRILEGDHVPRPPPLPLPVHATDNYYKPGQPQVNSYNENIYPYEPTYRSAPRAPPVPYRRPQYSVEEGSGENGSYSELQYRTPHTRPSFIPSAPEEEPHKGPHTFGSGYSFEFSG